MRLSLKLFVLAFAVPFPLMASAQTNPVADHFFNDLGGSSHAKTVGRDSPIVRPLEELEPQLFGARFFKDKNGREPFIVADRGLEIFASSCAANSGSIVPADDDRTVAFLERVSGHLTRPTGFKHQWRAKAAICEDEEGMPLAGYLAVLQDNSEIVKRGDPGSWFLANVFGMATPTAIYLVKPGLIQSRASAQREQEAEERRVVAVEERVRQFQQEAEDFQENLAVGDETNCGAVISVRGPMAEVAVPVNRRAPNGEPTFWSRKERLLPPGHGVCTFGL